jgi:hypothetical protein
MTGRTFTPLPDAERVARVGAAHAHHGLQVGDLARVRAVLAAEHGYLRYFGSPTELGRALPSLAILLGEWLAATGWNWARAEDGLAMIAADGTAACLLHAAASALLDGDDTTFEWFVEQTRGPERDRLPGIVAIDG